MGKARSSRKMVTVTARFTERQRDRLEQIASTRDLTLSELLRDIVSNSTNDIATPYQMQNDAGFVRQDKVASVAL